MQHKPSSATASVTIKALIINPFKKSKPHHEKDCGWHNENPKHDLSSELAPGLMLLAVNTGSRLTAHELRRPLTTGLQSVQHLSLTPDAVLILAFSLRLSRLTFTPSDNKLLLPQPNNGLLLYIRQHAPCFKLVPLGDDKWTFYWPLYLIDPLYCSFF